MVLTFVEIKSYLHLTDVETGRRGEQLYPGDIVSDYAGLETCALLTCGASLAHHCLEASQKY